MLEDTLSDEQISAVLTYIDSEPETWPSYFDFFVLEAMLVDYFAKISSEHPEMVTEMASPIW